VDLLGQLWRHNPNNDHSSTTIACDLRCLGGLASAAGEGAQGGGGGGGGRGGGSLLAPLSMCSAMAMVCNPSRRCVEHGCVEHGCVEHGCVVHGCVEHARSFEPYASTAKLNPQSNVEFETCV
jgi:hypothetical protein